MQLYYFQPMITVMARKINVIFTKDIGNGRVGAVMGSSFNGWYDQESIIFMNAVQYTAGNPGVDLRLVKFKQEKVLILQFQYRL